MYICFSVFHFVKASQLLSGHMNRSQPLIGQPFSPPQKKMLKRPFVETVKKTRGGGANQKCYQPFGNASGKKSTAAIIRIGQDYAGF